MAGRKTGCYFSKRLFLKYGLQAEGAYQFFEYDHTGKKCTGGCVSPFTPDLNLDIVTYIKIPDDLFG
jgi:hypothetical protein